MTKTVVVVVYELRWEGTDEVYVGSTVLKLSERLRGHRCRPCACYAHLDINQAQIVPVLTYRTSDRLNRRPEAAHKVLLRSKNIPVLADPNDNHRSPLWFSVEHKAKVSAAQKGAKNHRYAPFTVTWPDGRVDRWEILHEASAAYGIGVVTIWRYLTGMGTPGGNKRTAHLKGTIWQYV